MMSSSLQPKLADRHRDAMRRFMRERKINPYSWANRAGVPSSAIYNFLKGDSDSLTSATLARLAEVEKTTISKILGEINNDSKIDGLSVQLPPHLLTQLKRWAETEEMSIDQLLTLAVAEKLSRLDVEAFYRVHEGREAS